MKYFLICDFSTLSCNRAKVAEILSENEINFLNHNNFFWELNVPENFGTPFNDTVAEDIHYLFADFQKPDTLLVVVKAEEYCSS